MSKIYNIHYTDAYYGYAKTYPKTTKLPHNEAYGYLNYNTEKDLIVTFIKKREEEYVKTSPVIKGLIIPQNAVVSKNNIFLSQLDDFKKNSKLAITWKDILYVANLPRNECPTMYTEGILIKNNNDHLVIGEPETIRINPKPLKNHPAEKPYYYVIPKAFIIECARIDKNTK